MYNNTESEKSFSAFVEPIIKESNGWHIPQPQR